MLGLAARLPDPLIGLLPHVERAPHLVLEDRPQPLGNVAARPRVQIDRVEHGAVHVVLALPVGAVSDPDRRGALVALEVGKLLLVQVPLAAEAVHDLERSVAVAPEVGDELHEVVGLPVEAERVQRPQRERRVAHPAVPVVPVALTAGRLGQRRRGGRHRRAGRRIRQTLQRERRALEVLAPPMVGEAAAGEPVAPVVERGLESVLGIGAVLGAVQAVPPSERDEPLLALVQGVPGARPVALDPDPQVGDQPQDRLPVARLGRRPVLLDHLPLGRRAPVVEHRLAHRLDLNRALDAFDVPHQHVIGVVIGRRPRVRRLVGVVVVPRPDRQPIVDHDPARRRHPRRLDDHRSRHVAHRQRHDRPVRPDAKRARAPVEQRPEHARRVEPRNAHPLDAAVGSDQRTRVAVRQEPVVRDRRERRPAAQRQVVGRDRDARAHSAGGAYPSGSRGSASRIPARSHISRRSRPGARRP